MDLKLKFCNENNYAIVDEILIWDHLIKSKITLLAIFDPEYSPEVRNEPKIACFFPAVWAVVHVGA